MSKLTDITLHTLIEKATELYTRNENPLSFMDFAAHKIAAAAAAEYCLASADAAAFAAAAHFTSSVMESAAYSGRLISSKISANDKIRHYEALTHKLRGSAPPTPVTTVLHFEEVLSDLGQNTYSAEARTAFEKTFTDEKSKQAYKAACAIYPLAGASAYASYIHAASVAARYSSNDARKQIFRQTIKTRLTADLGYEPISPCLMMQIMCSDFLTIAGAIILTIGLVSLTLGICGLAIPSVGIFLANLSIQSTIVTTVGAVSTTIGTGMFVGQFFANKKWEQDTEESRKAIKNLTKHNVP